MLINKKYITAKKTAYINKYMHKLKQYSCLNNYNNVLFI